ncbi:MAG: hypothetical protein LLF76_03070 [Planctomycetaceae bacterium]|nr:hypothetical protein [Planctomycetaceae bacterium]
MGKEKGNAVTIPDDMEGRGKMIADLQQMLAKLQAGNDKLNEDIITIDENLAKANELVARQAGEIKLLKTAQDTTQPAAKVDGFVLMPGDPFAQGTMKHYLNLCDGKCKQPPYLPFTLPYKDPNGTKAIISYGIRADAAGDTERVAAVRKVMDKFVAPK